MDTKPEAEEQSRSSTTHIKEMIAQCYRQALWAKSLHEKKKLRAKAKEWEAQL